MDQFCQKNKAEIPFDLRSGHGSKTTFSMMDLICMEHLDLRNAAGHLEYIFLICIRVSNTFCIMHLYG